MLRAPQTVGEPRGRAGRLHEFESLGQIDSTLQGLIAREDGPYVQRLTRQPGHKESRHANLLYAPIDEADEPAPEFSFEAPSSPSSPTRLDRPETAVEALHAELQALKSSLGC